jgi:hypothetical protein
MEVEWVAIRIRCRHGWLEFSPKAPNYSRDVRDAVKAGRLLKAGAPIELIKKLFIRRNMGQTKLF